MKIMVNCGHGKSSDGTWDSGCVYGAYTEATLMLPITKAAVKYLRDQGITVLSDADTNNNKNMIADVAWANRENVSLYVSIHCDYSGAPVGVMPLYYSTEGKRLATCLNNAIKSGMGMKSRGVVKRTDLYELNDTNMPSCVLETGSIKLDLNFLKNFDEYGKCIAKGICSYLGITYKEKTVGLTKKYKAVVAANVYKDHSISSGKTGQINMGSVSTATDWYRDDWCYIPYSKVKGWVPIKGSQGTYLEPYYIKYIVVNQTGVNVYEDHTTKSKCTQNLKRGSQCTATMWYDNKWAYIPYVKGWVAISCLHEGGIIDAFLYELNEVAETMIKNNFTYSQSGLKYTLAAAVKSDHRTDCARYVSYAMQALNLLPSAQTIWLNDKVNGTKKGVAYIYNSGKFTVSHPNKLPKYCNLKPGDIVGFHYYVDGVEGQHTQVLAEIKNGTYLWYSGGKSDVNGKSYGAKEKPTYMNRPVTTLIRIK